MRRRLGAHQRDMGVRFHPIEGGHYAVTISLPEGGRAYLGDVEREPSWRINGQGREVAFDIWACDGMGWQYSRAEAVRAMMKKLGVW